MISNLAPTYQIVVADDLHSSGWEAFEDRQRY